MRCPSVSPSVCPSVTFVDHVKTNKHIFEIFAPSGTHTILVFPYQTGWRYSDRNPSNGGVESRWGRQKRYSGRMASLHTGLQCCQPYESRSVKNKAAANGGKRRAEHSRRRPSSVVRTRRRRSVCDGSTLYAGEEVKSPADTTPLVITPFSAALGHRRTEPGGYFC